MTAGSTTIGATSNDRPSLPRALAAATSVRTAPLGVPNKPVLPTATTRLDENPAGPLRRQTGKPLGNQEDWGQRPSKGKAHNGRRTTSSGRREHRATSDKHEDPNMGAIVRITGWREGLLKVSMTKAIRRISGLGLAEAKSCTDMALDGEIVEVAVVNADAAWELARELVELGAIAHVVDDLA